MPGVPGRRSGRYRHVEGEELLGYDAGPSVCTVDPLGEGRSLVGQVVVEHGLTQFAAVSERKGKVSAMPVHGDGQRLAGQMGGADGRPARQVPPAPPASPAEPEGAVRK